MGRTPKYPTQTNSQGKRKRVFIVVHRYNREGKEIAKSSHRNSSFRCFDDRDNDDHYDNGHGNTNDDAHLKRTCERGLDEEEGIGCYLHIFPPTCEWN
jgi:hypothetical protein